MAGMWIRKGVRLLEEEPRSGPPVQRRQYCLLAIRITLNRGEVVQHPGKCLPHQMDEHHKTQDDGYFRHRVRVDRENLVSGVSYALQGMRVGGYRKVAIAPRLWRERNTGHHSS